MSRAAFYSLIILSIPVAAGAQPAPIDAAPSGRAQADFRMTRVAFHEASAPARRGMIGAVELGDGLQLGVGRFEVPELAQPRFHTERESRPADVRHRDQGIAAVGLSFSF